jgi:6-phosphogluconolactonase
MATGGAPRPVPLPIDNLHPFPTTLAIGQARGAAWCANELAGELDSAGLERDGDWPIFDLVVVGIGADGHLLSVFPGSAALESGDLALSIPAPTHIEPHVERVTLNPRVLGAARQVLVVVGGSEKAPVLADIFGSDHDPGRWPAQLARHANATWIVEAAAAEHLSR